MVNENVGLKAEALKGDELGLVRIQIAEKTPLGRMKVKHSETIYAEVASKFALRLLEIATGALLLKTFRDAEEGRGEGDGKILTPKDFLN